MDKKSMKALKAKKKVTKKPERTRRPILPHLEPF